MKLINYGALSLHLTGEKGVIRSNRKPINNRKAIEEKEQRIYPKISNMKVIEHTPNKVWFGIRLQGGTKLLTMYTQSYTAEFTILDNTNTEYSSNIQLQCYSFETNQIAIERICKVYNIRNEQILHLKIY